MVRVLWRQVNACLLLCTFHVAYAKTLLYTTPSPSCDTIISRALERLDKRNTPELPPVSCAIERKVVLWEWFLKGRGYSFDDIYTFLQTSSHWPEQKRLREAAEQIVHTVHKKKRIEYFSVFPPVSSTGINAYLALYGKDTKKLRGHVSHFWRHRNFSSHEEAIFYRKYRRYITNADNRYRISRLIIEGNRAALMRMRTRVGKMARRLIDTCMRLIQYKRVSFSHMPRALVRNQGFIFRRIKYYLKQNQTQKAFTYFYSALHAGHIKGFYSQWWKIKDFFARYAVRNGAVHKGYAILQDHGLYSDAYRYSEAEWLRGWIALRHLKQPKKAKKHFVQMYNVVKTPVSKAKALYWIARCYDALNKKEKARVHYVYSSKYKSTFYGQLAAKKIGKVLVHTLTRRSHSPILTSEEKEIDNVAGLYMAKNRTKRGRDFLLHFAKNCTSDSRNYVVERAESLGLLPIRVLVSKYAGRKGHIGVQAAYPLVKECVRSKGTISSLVHGLIRQESGFDPKAESPSGALGLTQLMPATARSVCKGLKLQYAKSKLTKNSGYNLRLGNTHFWDLMKRFNQNYILALAAYNAGTTRVGEWIGCFGDPRHTTIDTIDWIESIPFSETRAYVQRVLESVPVYNALLQKCK